MRLISTAPSSASRGWLIDYANGKTGLCYPSQPNLRAARYSRATVRKAIASLNARGLVESLERFDARGRTSNAYLIAWAPLFAAYPRDMRRETKNGRYPPSKTGRYPPSKRGRYPPSKSGR